MGQHTAPGALSGVLRACHPVARRHRVHSAPGGERGGAGDHAQSGPR